MAPENRRQRCRCTGMRATKRMGVLLAMSCLCAGCEPPEGKVESGPPELGSDLAKPVTAPMAVRERLLHDVEGAKQRANVRARDLQGVIDSNR